MAAGRRGSSNSQQLYGARPSCDLMCFGVTVWAAGYAQPLCRAVFLNGRSFRLGMWRVVEVGHDAPFPDLFAGG